MNDNYQENFKQRLQEIMDKIVPEICEFYGYLEKDRVYRSEENVFEY